MILDLTGNTVTQSMNRLQEALQTCKDAELTAKTDNEAVKLNLYNLLHRMGYRCTSERIGAYHHIAIQTNSGGNPSAPLNPADSGPAAERETTTAFPVGHMSGDGSEKAPPVRRRGMGRRAREAAIAAGQPDPMETPASKAHPMENPHYTSWLIIQSDQIGNRDSRLGFELLEDLLVHLDTTRYEGIFLVHRGVTLLDPTYQGGRGLRVLLRKNLPILACEKSTAYYKLEDKIAKPVKAVPFHHISKLAEHHDLVWI
ncbi:MAG: hypothetical protein QNK37_09835 [Acidobacteriota bacterium]|nr:hypothetical protein [Acidobacteriota bacterium]